MSDNHCLVELGRRMPPSPAMRCSPGRERKVENHKRGRSLESGILFREKDDDLALFNEMQSRESDNFLLQSNDKFEDAFSTKLRYFSDYKLGISIPVRGESSDLLNVEGEKNDYDWLLTPPDTPLFPSLDEETPPVNLAQRGRPRSQPISISRSSTMEKSYRSSRGSASPNRLSPSPRFDNSTLQTRGRPSSAPHSSPTPVLRHATPSRRPSPPPSKPSTPGPRSSTPTPWGMSTGSGGTVTSSRARGTSPVKTSRGNSASPKIRAWQSNMPGFSLEAPPNLRTSLADRPASYVRGSSPASRNGRDASSKSGRQSMSPTASRSVSSSYSHDRDRFSSHSKGSVASSRDDDVDSLQSVPLGSSEHSASRRVGAFPNNRAMAFSKKPSRTVSSSSAPKRSFDLALRQMDHRKGPQNMFRPLLSSVPSSTFYVGKASSAHRTLISRNSSVTTSSNASSDQGTSGAHDTEGSDQNQEDVTSGVIAAYPEVQDEVFVLDKADGSNDDLGHGTHNVSPGSQHANFNGGPTVNSQTNGSENFSDHDAEMAITVTSQTFDVEGDFSDTDSLKDMVLCSKCSHMYHALESIERDLKLCPDCRRSDVPLTITPVTAIMDAENPTRVSTKISEEYESFEALKTLAATPESPEVADMGESRAGEHGETVKESHTLYNEASLIFLSKNSHAQPLVEEAEHRLPNQQVMGQPTVSCNIPDGGTRDQQMQQLSGYPDLKVDVLECAGISVLLKRSSSGKGPVVQSRTFTATSIPHGDLSYVRDSANSIRSSIGHGSLSASSSVDLGPVRQMEIRVQRQLSGKKSDVENCRYDMNTKHQRTGSTLSGTSNQTFQASSLATSTHEECLEGSVAHVEKDDVDVTCVAPREHLRASENIELDDTCTDVESKSNSSTMVASISELSNHTTNIHLGDRPMTFSNFEESASCENGEGLSNNTRNISDTGASALTREYSAIEEDGKPNPCVDRVYVAEVPAQSSLDTISEIDVESGHLGSPVSQVDVASPNSVSSIDELQEPSDPTIHDKDIIAAVADSDTSDHAHGIHEESTVMVGAQGGTKARSLTLEEATDTILFCSSIVHNLAFDAATIAMEKEKSVPLEGSWPTVTILGKLNSDRKDPRGRNGGKRTSKSQKARQRRVETDTKPPPSNTETDENSCVSTTRVVGFPKESETMKPPKPDSKCNCSVM